MLASRRACPGSAADLRGGREAAEKREQVQAACSAAVAIEICAYVLAKKNSGRTGSSAEQDRVVETRTPGWANIRMRINGFLDPQLEGDERDQQHDPAGDAAQVAGSSKPQDAGLLEAEDASTHAGRTSTARGSRSAPDGAR